MKLSCLNIFWEYAEKTLQKDLRIQKPGLSGLIVIYKTA